MPRHRDINPSAAALRMRARRAGPPNVNIPPARGASLPALEDTASLEESLRVRAVHDGRRSAELAEQEHLRTRKESGQLVTRSDHDAVIVRFAGLVVAELERTLVAALVDPVEPEQQPAARHRATLLVREMRQQLADAVKASP